MSWTKPDLAGPEWEDASLLECARMLAHIGAADPNAPREKRESFASKGPADSPTFVYRMWDARGDLLYVGMTYTPKGRVEQHRKTKPWFRRVAKIEWERHLNRLDAMFGEADAINRECPRYNIQIPTPRWNDHLPASIEAEQRESLDKQARKHFGMSGPELLEAWFNGALERDDERLFYVANLLAAVAIQNERENP